MLDDLDLRTVRAFVAVVDAGDFTSAARSLGMTRSAVGKSVARLEAALGARLLNRTTRRVAATSDGAAFHESCARLLAGLTDAAGAVSQKRQDARGTLRLSLPDAYGRRRIQPILQDYMRRWPAVGVEATFSDRIGDLIEEGLDLAIRIGAAETSAGLVTRVVDRIRGVLCASPAYIEARGMPGEAGGFEDHDLLLFGRCSAIMAWPPLPAAGGTRMSRGRTRMVLDSAEALRAFAVDGFGIAHLPDFLVAADLAAGRLVALPRPEAGSIAVHALYPERRLLPPRLRHFLDMVADGLR